MRARVRWVEEGECSSSFFCKLEKKRRSESGVTALRDSDNVVDTGAEGIQSVLSSFYADRFSKEETNLALQASLLFKVSDRVPFDRVGPLSVAECSAALSTMAKGKAPGIDGLTLEFYVKFWDVLVFLLSPKGVASSRLRSRRGIALIPSIGGLSVYSMLVIRSPPVR